MLHIRLMLISTIVLPAVLCSYLEQFPIKSNSNGSLLEEERMSSSYLQCFYQKFHQLFEFLQILLTLSQPTSALTTREKIVPKKFFILKNNDGIIEDNSDLILGDYDNAYEEYYYEDWEEEFL